LKAGVKGGVKGKLPPSTITVDNIDGTTLCSISATEVCAVCPHAEELGSRFGGRPCEARAGPGQVGKLGKHVSAAPAFSFDEWSSATGSSGLPYVIDSFDYAGQVSYEKFEAATDLTGDWGQGRLASPGPRHNEFPMGLTIIDFNEAK
jgi:hypothetical protein